LPLGYERKIGELKKKLAIAEEILEQHNKANCEYTLIIENESDTRHQSIVLLTTSIYSLQLMCVCKIQTALGHFVVHQSFGSDIPKHLPVANGIRRGQTTIGCAAPVDI